MAAQIGRQTLIRQSHPQHITRTKKHRPNPPALKHLDTLPSASHSCIGMAQHT